MTMSLIIIKRQTGFKLSQLLRRLVAIFVFTGMMALVVMIVKSGLNLVIDYNKHHLLSYFLCCHFWIYWNCRVLWFSLVL